MDCPKCGAPKTRLRSRQGDPSPVVRIRYLWCLDCGVRFRTTERIDWFAPRTRKSGLTPIDWWSRFTSLSPTTPDLEEPK